MNQNVLTVSGDWKVHHPRELSQIFKIMPEKHGLK